MPHFGKSRQVLFSSFRSHLFVIVVLSRFEGPALLMREKFSTREKHVQIGIFRVLVFGSVYAFYWNFVGTSFMSRLPNCYGPFSLAPEGYFHNFVTAPRTRVSCNGRFVPLAILTVIKRVPNWPPSDCCAPHYAELLCFKVLPFGMETCLLFCAIRWGALYQFQSQWSRVEGLNWGLHLPGCWLSEDVTWFDPLHTLHISLTIRFSFSAYKGKAWQVDVM